MFLCSTHIKVTNDVLMEFFLGESLNTEKIIIDMGVTVVYYTLDFLQLFYDELAALENIDLYLPVLCAVDGCGILSFVDERLQLDLHSFHHLLDHCRLVMLKKQYLAAFAVELTRSGIQLLDI